MAHCEAGAVDGHAGAQLHAVQLARREAYPYSGKISVAVDMLYVPLALHNACRDTGSYCNYS